MIGLADMKQVLFNFFHKGVLLFLTQACKENTLMG